MDDRLSRGGSDALLKSIPDATSEQEIRAVRYIARHVDLTAGDRYELLSALGLVDVARGMQAGEAA